MSYATIKTKIVSFSKIGAPFALTQNEITYLNDGVSYSLNDLYSKLNIDLRNSAISVIRDQKHDAIVFIPNTKTITAIEHKINTNTFSYTPINEDVGPKTESSPGTVGDGIQTAAQFNVSNSFSSRAAHAYFTIPDQYLYTPCSGKLLYNQYNNISLWIKDAKSFAISVCNNVSYNTLGEALYITTTKGATKIELLQYWPIYNGKTTTHNVRKLTVDNVGLSTGFNNIILDQRNGTVGFIVNGSYMTPKITGTSKPLNANQDTAYLMIGHYRKQQTRYAAYCRVKNIAVFDAHNLDISRLYKIYANGEDCDIRTLGITPQFYFPLNAKTTDMMNTSVPVTQKGISYSF